MSTTMSANSIKAQMPHLIFTRIFGEPTHKQVKAVICKLTVNLMAVTCPWGHNKGHLNLLQDQAVYLACNGEVFTIPAIDSLPYPIILSGATTAECKELQANNVTIRQVWGTSKLMLLITCNQFLAAINDVYYATLDDPIEGLNGVDLRALVGHILTKYSQISQPDLDNNMSKFHKGINPSFPLAVYTRKQENARSLLPALVSLSPMP
jgi:hypothetical protein